MALHVRQSEPRMHLRDKVSADLRERLNKRALESTDVKKASVLLTQNKTKSGGIFWSALISVILILALIYLVFIF